MKTLKIKIVKKGNNIFIIQDNESVLYPLNFFPDYIQKKVNDYLIKKAIK